MRTCVTALHHLIVALLVGRDEDDLGPEAVPRLLEQLDAVGPAAALLGVPQDPALRLDVLVDQARDGGAKGGLLVGADPDEEPVGALDAGRQRGADPGPGAYADSSLEHGRGVSDAGCELRG